MQSVPCELVCLQVENHYFIIKISMETHEVDSQLLYPRQYCMIHYLVITAYQKIGIYMVVYLFVYIAFFQEHGTCPL